ncbi:MAG: nucleoside-diphosphate kinase [Candidatus Wildermuthbacteria bacterium]|nr:nucleoside-diphosphate kinase [Candidatus Wildermuthbacteria bacterium]
MAHFKEEKTLVMIKPDGIQRTLVGEIIKRYERAGLKLVGMKMFVPEKDKVEQHYLIDPEWKRKVGEKAIESYRKRNLQPSSENPIEVGERVLDGLRRYMTSGPVVAMVWQGAHAVELVRKLTGSTEPLTSDVGSIRGDFVLDSYRMADVDGRAVRNLIHASGSTDEAEKEIVHWFSKEEIINYKLVQESILYDVNLDGILE